MKHSRAGSIVGTITGALTAALLLLSSQTWAEEAIAGRASVIDGDTIEIHGQRIRLWGIDAPESRQICHVVGEPWRCGQQSALALADYLGQHTVECIEQDRDRYGRVVAICHARGDDVAAWLVREGWALDWPRYSSGAYAREQTQARGNGRGVWRGEFEQPWEWRQQ